MKASKQLRKAAMKAPSNPYLVSSWCAGDPGFGAIASRLSTFEEWWDRTASLDDRRMFLLFVAEDFDGSSQ